MDTKKFFEAKMKLNQFLEAHPELHHYQHLLDKHMKHLNTEQRINYIFKLIVNNTSLLGKKLENIKKPLERITNG